MAKRIVRYDLHCTKKVSAKGRKECYISEWNMDIDLERHFFVFQGLRSIVKLHRSLSCKLERREDNIFITIENRRYGIRTVEEIDFLCQVYTLNIYNVVLPHGTVVMDVGMNIADTTLYFANMKEVFKVIGYEPFVPTFKGALRNIDLNPDLTEKIVPINYGLSDVTCQKECDYSPLLKGLLSINDPVENIFKDSNNVVKEIIEVHKASEELVKIRKDYPHNYLVMQINCEGSEFEIIEDLHSNRLLSAVDMFIIEWHYRSPDPIILSLVDSGFTVILRDNTKEKLGFMYAIKR